MKRTFVLPGLKSNGSKNLSMFTKRKEFFSARFPILGFVTLEVVLGFIFRKKCFSVSTFCKISCCTHLSVWKQPFCRQSPQSHRFPAPGKDWDIDKENIMLPSRSFEDSIAKCVAIFQLICAPSAGAVQPQANGSSGSALLQPQLVPEEHTRCAVVSFWSPR